jgi:hypothetical protein
MTSATSNLTSGTSKMTSSTSNLTWYRVKNDVSNVKNDVNNPMHDVNNVKFDVFLVLAIKRVYYPQCFIIKKDVLLKTDALAQIKVKILFFGYFS